MTKNVQRVQVVSNTSPLITLVENMADGAQFLEATFSKVLVPLTVIEELIEPSSSVSPFPRPVFNSPGEYLAHYNLLSIVDLKPIEINMSIPGIDILDIGEAAAISLARKENKLLLIDEKKGRRVAKDAGLQIRRSAKQIVVAAQLNWISCDEAKYRLNLLVTKKRIGLKIYHSYMEELECLD